MIMGTASYVKLSHVIVFPALIWYSILGIGQAEGQPTTDTLSLEWDSEEWLESRYPESEPDDDLITELAHLKAYPLDLNTCSHEDLLRIPFITPRIARSIIAFRKNRGRFVGLADLLALPEITPALFNDLRLYVTLSSAQAPPSGSNKSERHEAHKKSSIVFSQSIHRRLELPTGFKVPHHEGGFRGTALAAFTRLNVDLEHGIGLRLAMEKDAGEAMRWIPKNHSYFFDHISFAVSIDDIPLLNHIIIGDYSMDLGQGLLFSRPFGNGKSTDPIQPGTRNTTRVRPSASRSEGISLRGITFSAPLTRRLSVRAFRSSQRIDASFLSDSLRFVTSIASSGLHRTRSELDRKNALKETISGLHIRHNSDLGEIGMVAHYTAFSDPFLKGDASHERFDLEGRTLSGLSAYTSIQRSGIELFGEAARSFPGTYALLSGMLIHLEHRTRLLLMWRFYSNNFHSLHGLAFGERRSHPRQEKGFYGGLQYRANKYWNVSLFFDHYTYTWPSTTIPRPATGVELFTKIEFLPRPWLRVYLQHRFETKPTQEQHTELLFHTFKSLDYTRRHAVRLHMDFLFSPMLKIKARVENVTSHTPSDSPHGIAIYQDLTFSPSKSTKLLVRFTSFDTDGGESIIYIYENDLTYRYSIRPYSGRGVRNFVLLKQQFGKHLLIEAKYSLTRFSDAARRGSGIDAISGTRAREIHMQIIWQF